MLPISDMFTTSTRAQSHGIEGYQVQKKYIGYNSEASKIKKAELKKGSYLDDYQKMHGSTPGPGVYNYATNLWPEKVKHLKFKPSQKKTYIDEIMVNSKKEKRPAPGHYKLEKTAKEIEEEKKALARRKITHADRSTYLDGIEYEATQTPGVGKYNTRERPKSCTTYKKNNPEEWRKKHAEQEKVSKKFKKMPDMGSYNPHEVQSYTRKKTKEGEWGRLKRFEDQKGGSGLGPGKYIGVDDWSVAKSKGTGGEIVTRTRPKSAYYN